MNDNLPVPVPVRAAGADAVALASRPAEMSAFALLVRVVLRRAAERNDASAASADDALREGAALLERVASGEPGAMQLLQRALARFALARSDVDAWFVRSGLLPWTWEEASAAADVQFPRIGSSADPGRNRIAAVRSAMDSYSRWLEEGSPADAANVALLLLDRLQEATMVRLFSMDGVAPRRVARPVSHAAASGGASAPAAAPTSASAQSAEPPRCPKCGAPMRKRIKRDTGEEFWGCSAYSSGCRGTRSM